MKSTLIKGAQIINENKSFIGDVLIKEGLIADISDSIKIEPQYTVIQADGLILIPGMIDDQVHFREPGLTHKADIYTESKAAVAGGITSYMEMPNTNPQTTTQQLLEEKYQIGAQKSLANFSFFMGATNDNLDEVLKTDSKTVCGVKVFMGSSTGNMLVDDTATLEKLFASYKGLIATHCEDEKTIKTNESNARKKYGDSVPITAHPIIRSEEACYKSSSKAVKLAKKYNTRLHVLHLSTEKELALFDASTSLENKRITSEACIHHLWFSDDDYKEKGTRIKWNPAVKTKNDRKALLKAINNDRIDIIATDHAPHTLEEKNNSYFKAPSGGPLVQHALLALFDLYFQGQITLEKIVQKTSHHPADLFQIHKRGYIRKGYYADVVLIDPKNSWTVQSENILYKCGWSPFEGHTFTAKVMTTFVNGHMVYNQGVFDESQRGMRLKFDRL